MSSYKLEAKGDTDRLAAEALAELMHKPELLALTAHLAPERTVAFWAPEADVEALELELGAGLRLKTRGDGPFLDSLAKLDAGTVTRCNFAGDAKTGASWTDNIMAQKSAEGAAAEAREQGDGAEDEEWPEEIQQQIVRETFHLVLKRDDNICNFLEGGSLMGGSDYKLIYRHYATLYFVFCVDSSESELGILDLIQVFVETLDKCFENVCELDLIFHMDKVHYILQEVVMGGMVLETNMNEIVAQMDAQGRLEKSEVSLRPPPAPAARRSPGEGRDSWWGRAGLPRVHLLSSASLPDPLAGGLEHAAGENEVWPSALLGVCPESQEQRAARSRGASPRPHVGGGPEPRLGVPRGRCPRSRPHAVGPRSPAKLQDLGGLQGVPGPGPG
ncbi:PREDICTED: uncharacterized protein LOC101635494 [Condylura cristata]|uniref:uncharacterized protein LOC101635494 n=1 Tax=Condylura cristata TaxID=143302 RepID=UPI000642E347|nr:PREDICTED: uncharacterized protein LOC101635494 [Condylura cristata]